MNPQVVPALRVRDVVKRYAGRGDQPVQALSGVSLDVQPGEFFGLLGPNGAGKTTLISIIAGLARATAGVVEVMGHDTATDPVGARMKLGVVPQELVFDPFFTVRETLRNSSGYYGVRTGGNGGSDDWIDEVLANLDLTSKADTNMRALSGGMKRRVLVAQALVHRPPVIILDEPTAGVDVELRQTLWRFISRLNADGHTIILTTHYLEEAEQLCTRIAMLKAGQIVALDSTAGLLARLSGLQLVARLSRPAPEAIASRAHTLPNGKTAIRLAGYSEVEPLLTQLREAGCGIDEIEVLRADLEDVFLQLTGKDGNETDLKVAA